MIDQLSVFLENRPGRLAEMARVLGQSGHNLRALVVADTSEFGVARMIVDRPKAAREALESAGFGVSITPVIAVEIPDQPGGIADTLELLGEAGVNVEYTYAFVPPGGDSAATVFRIEDAQTAMDALTGAGMAVLEAGVLYDAD